jgi:hypothetical protein
MRNLFLGLLLANLLFLAWQVWVDPSAPVPAPAGDDSLDLYAGPAGRPAGRAPAVPGPEPAAPAPLPSGACLRVGPLDDAVAAQQAARALVDRGFAAEPIARDLPVWLGHWVQVAGFESTASAEAARQRLAAGGLPDALLMQDGSRPLISLGVFRDRDGADRVAAAAAALGFAATVRDRFRPGVEHWVLVVPRAGQGLQSADLALPGTRILRAEATPCPGTGLLPGVAGPSMPAAGAAPVDQPL